MAKEDFTRGHTDLSREKARIVSIYAPDSGDRWTVGQSGVTEIIAYDENGEMAHIPWLAVLTHAGIWVRLPARNVSVFYQ